MQLQHKHFNLLQAIQIQCFIRQCLASRTVAVLRSQKQWQRMQADEKAKLLAEEVETKHLQEIVICGCVGVKDECSDCRREHRWSVLNEWMNDIGIQMECRSDGQIQEPNKILNYFEQKLQVSGL